VSENFLDKGPLLPQFADNFAGMLAWNGLQKRSEKHAATAPDGPTAVSAFNSSLVASVLNAPGERKRKFVIPLDRTANVFACWQAFLRTAGLEVRSFRQPRKALQFVVRVIGLLSDVGHALERSCQLLSKSCWAGEALRSIRTCGEHVLNVPMTLDPLQR